MSLIKIYTHTHTHTHIYIYIYMYIRTIVVFCNTRTKRKNTGTQEHPKHYEILKSKTKQKSTIRKQIALNLRVACAHQV